MLYCTGNLVMTVLCRSLKSHPKASKCKNMQNKPENPFQTMISQINIHAYSYPSLLEIKQNRTFFVIERVPTVD